MRVSFEKSDQKLVQAARDVALALQHAGYEVYFAGGCVRDAILERVVNDFDIATSATPEQIEALFVGHTVAVGKAFGVILVLSHGFTFDVATFRADGLYLDGRRPVEIALSNAQGDARRRDFTVNGLFCNPVTGVVVDYVQGLADLHARVIRAIGDPAMRFREDHLRLLRAVRFAAILEFQIEENTWQALTANATGIDRVSAERVAMEFERILFQAPHPSLGLNLLLKAGLLSRFLPEVAALHGVAQPPQFHPEGDVWTHTCLMLDEIPPPREPVLAWATLLHDIGKPLTFCEQVDVSTGLSRIRFPCHAPVGAKIAEKLLMRLRQPLTLITQVKALVLGHMQFVEAPQMRRAKLRRFLGADYFPTLLVLMRLDILHSNGELATWDFLKEAFDSFKAEPILPEPLVRGRDLQEWGMASGPGMGRILQFLYDAQLEGEFTSREQAHVYLTERGMAQKAEFKEML